MLYIIYYLCEIIKGSKPYGAFLFTIFPSNVSLTMMTLSRSNHKRCSVRKCVLRNFTKFTGKHMYQSLFFNKVAGLFHRTPLADASYYQSELSLHSKLMFLLCSRKILVCQYHTENRANINYVWVRSLPQRTSNKKMDFQTRAYYKISYHQGEKKNTKSFLKTN